MHRIGNTLLGLYLVTLLLLGMSTRVAGASDADYGVPTVIDPAANYLFFHHNYYVETKGTDGDCNYYGILKAFSDQGFRVISEIRPKDASVIEYGAKTAANVRKLLEAGVPPEHITVAGHSKGGVITLQVAAQLDNPQVNYAVLAGCGIKGLERGYPDPARLKGRFLSLYAISDKVAGRCEPAFGQPRKDVRIKEQVLDTPAGHQLFFKPAALWLEPLSVWLKQDN